MAGSEIVVGVDGSDASRRALRWALREGATRGTSVRAIMVWESRAVLAGPAPMLMRPDLAPHHVQQEHRNELREMVTECESETPGVAVHAELAEGHPVAVLAERSENAAMLVLGDHGRGTVSEAVLGSVALHVIRHAHCPVVVIPGGMRETTPRGGPTEQPGGDPILD